MIGVMLDYAVHNKWRVIVILASSVAPALIISVMYGLSSQTVKAMLFVSGGQFLISSVYEMTKLNEEAGIDIVYRFYKSQEEILMESFKANFTLIFPICFLITSPILFLNFPLEILIVVNYVVLLGVILISNVLMTSNDAKKLVMISVAIVEMISLQYGLKENIAILTITVALTYIYYKRRKYHDYKGFID